MILNVFLLFVFQIDSFRDDFFTERKERERLQSQKDKMKREHEVAQSRIASLQEQVENTYTQSRVVTGDLQSVLRMRETNVSIYRVSNHPDFVGIISILLENPESGRNFGRDRKIPILKPRKLFSSNKHGNEILDLDLR